MYPKNAASPQRIAIGPVVQISDGAVQTSGVSVKVLPQGTTASAGGGTIAYEEGIVHYVPTQAETNYASFIVIAYKTGCIPCSVTVVTSASGVAGYAGLDWANINAPTTAQNLSGTNIDTDQVVASVSGAVGSVTGNVGGNVAGSVGSVTGNVGGNVAGSVGSVTGAVGSVTGLTAANLDVAVSTRLATAGYTAPDNTSIAAILVDTAEIGVAGAGLTNINLPNQTMDIVGNITGNLSGSVGSVTGLTAANLDTTISSRASAADLATVAGYLDTEIAAIKAKTDNLPAAPAAVGDIPTAIQNADALLNRDMSVGTDSGSATVRTPRQALRALRNKTSVSGSTLTITKEDDSTASWTAALTTDAAALPITGIDPAS